MQRGDLRVVGPESIEDRPDGIPVLDHKAAERLPPKTVAKFKEWELEAWR